MNRLNDLSSISIQHYTDAARREAAIDRLYADALAVGQAMECADIEEWASDWYDEAHERTQAERWSALSTEEQDTILEASEAEYAARWEAQGGRF